jgi:Pro-kumamolisin, activation domain
LKKAILLRSTAPALVSACAFALVLGAGSVPAGAAGSGGGAAGSSVARVALRGELPTIPSDVTRMGPVPGSQMLRLDVGLAGQNPAGLASEVAAVSTPGSPSYHQYLSSAQFAATYGPSAAEVAQVSTALRAEGLTVGTPTAGSTLLPVSGNARTISAAFGTPLEAVRLPDHLTSTVNTAAPQIPAALAPDITGIVGLSGLSEEHSMLRHDAVSGTGAASGAAAGSGTAASGLEQAHAAGPQACPDAASAAADDNGYTSTQLSADYGLEQFFAQGRTGIGQTIAIVEFERFSASDIATFEGCYGLSNPVRTVTVDGTPSGSTSGSGEAALDIELAAVNAPSASLVVYQAPNETTSGTSLDLYNQIATDDVAQVVTTSWGVCEQDNIPTSAVGQEEAIFERMAAQGQTVVAASGDEGSEDCYGPRSSPNETELAVDDPGSQPDVLSAGGTTLVGGAVGSQSVWNDCDGQALGFCQQNGGNGATGGGASTVWPKPTWQPAGSTTRTVPDLAYSADPSHGVVFYFARNGGWSDIGGTSVVAPTISGFLADSNQGCTSTRGLVGPALYAADTGANLTDITSGANDFTGTNHGDYPATAGYDEATGLGTPIEEDLGLALQGGDGCPSVAGLSVATGSISGGGAITLTGGGLADATAVTFGAAGPGTIVSRTETSLVVDPPSPGKALCVDVTVTNPLGTSAVSTADSFGFGASGNCNGYRLVASDGGIFDFGSATFDGSTGGIALQAPIVGMASTPDGGGYWLVAADGGVFSFGDAKFFGSTGGIILNQPIVAMASTPDGGGYWLVAADGGIFTFGDASYFGSTGAIHLNRPIVGMAVTPGGGGYWLVASDGGIFTFGNATYAGSTGSLRINSPIVTMAATPDGGGYWLVAADGGVFTFGDAQFFGSTGAIRLNQPIVGMAATPDGAGYWLVAADGGIFTFGDARFFGSTGAIHLNRPIVGMSGN